MQKLTKKQEDGLPVIRIDVAYNLHEGKPGFVAKIDVIYGDTEKCKSVVAMSAMMLAEEGKPHSRLAHVDVVSKFVSTLILGQMMGPGSFDDPISKLENTEPSGLN